MCRRSHLFALLLSSGAFTGETHADPIQCGQNVVTEGMTSYAVKRRCGEPDTIERADVSVVQRGADGADRLGTRAREYWIYERGWGKFPARLTVDDGVVTSIELLTSR